MSYRIPETFADCAQCLLDGNDNVTGDRVGDRVEGRSVVFLCNDHSGPNGEPAPYTGPDRYEPSAWVESIRGRLYRGCDTFVYRVIGYDPRSGVLVERVGVTRPEDRRRASLSERAIDRTYHRLGLKEAREFSEAHGLPWTDEDRERQ